MSASKEDILFDLEQGWSKGLSIQFLSARSSAKFDLSNCSVVKQVHGDSIVDWKNAGNPGVASVEADGIFATGDQFANSKKKMIVKTADCMPLVYVDRIKETVVIVHAGWRGLAQGIHLAPFERGLCTPRDTWMWLGPCLNGDSFQVRSDMWEQFPEHQNNPKYFRVDPKDESIRYFNSWDFVSDQLTGAGVELFYNVEVDTLTTRAFVSWRRAQKAGIEKLKVQNLTVVGFHK
ncbi:polyphenol oxidase family protein [bacterium]|nr:polyphenol oxidase family protein [bacterium]